MLTAFYECLQRQEPRAFLNLYQDASFFLEIVVKINDTFIELHLMF